MADRIHKLLKSIKLFLLPLQLSLRTKMLILTAITFVGFGVVFVMGVHLVTDVKIGSSRYTKIKNYHKSLEKIAELKSDFNQIRVEYLTVAEESNREIQKQGLNSIYLLNDRINRLFVEILQTIPSEHQKPFTDSRDEWQVFTDNMSGKIIPVILEGNRELALERLGSIQKYRYERVASNLRTVTETLNVLAGDLEKSTEQYIRGRVTTILVTSSLIALIILILALVITSFIVRPLRRAVAFAQAVSSGDLSKELHESVQDEVGILSTSLNSMVSGLGQMFGKIQVASIKLSEVSRTVSTASEQVSRESHIQKNNMERSSSAIHEISQATLNILSDVTSLSISNRSTYSSVSEMVASMSEIVRFSERLTTLSDEVNGSILTINSSVVTLDTSIENLNAKASETSFSISLLENSVLEIQQKSRTTSQLADQATIFAASGHTAVTAAIACMDEIRTSSKTAYDVITDLSGSVEEIGSIVTVINEINDRIALLALNARIISAQAGKSGPAFSLVASEFKALSTQTSRSTLGIVQKIERVQSQTKMAVEAIRKTELIVSRGEKLSHQSGEALSNIVAAVRQTSQEMDAIAVSIEKQRNGSSQIAEAVKNVSATVNYIAKASHELKQESAHILTNSEQMTYMIESVFRAMKENEDAVKQISNVSEHITLMIEQIKTNCEAESVEARRIIDAMEEIRTTLSNNLASAQTASHASSLMIHQVEFLMSAVNHFKHADSPSKF